MKAKLGPGIISLTLCALSTLNIQFSTVYAQGTTFTYQGKLNSGGSPVNGSYDLTFTLYNSSTAGVVTAGPVTNSATVVTSGLFTTLVNFGPNAFSGTSNWLAIAVGTNSANNFTTLTPRQQVTSTPYATYAMFANTASNVSGTIAAAQISGAIASANLAGIYGNALTLNNAGNSFSGSGENLTALNANNLASGTLPLARLSGITSNQLDAATWQMATNLNGGNAELASNLVSGIAITNAFITNTIFAGNGNGLINLQAAQLTSIGNTNAFSTGNFFVGAAGNVANYGSQNTAIGTGAMTNSTGSDNTAYGSGALANNAGNWNTAIGGTALANNNNPGGNYNTGVGYGALYNSRDATGNTAVGYDALWGNGYTVIQGYTAGSDNTAIGYGALSQLGQIANMNGGTGNIAVGYQAANALNSSESYDIYIGSAGVRNENNTIRLGTPGTQTNTYIAGVVNDVGGVQVGANGTTMSVIQSGQAIMPDSSLVQTNFTVTFPQAFTTVPKVIASLSGDPNYATANDTFALTIRAITSTTGFTVNVIRVDAPTGWSQQLRINWQAWQ